MHAVGLFYLAASRAWLGRYFSPRISNDVHYAIIIIRLIINFFSLVVYYYFACWVVSWECPAVAVRKIV